MGKINLFLVVFLSSKLSKLFYVLKSCKFKICFDFNYCFFEMYIYYTPIIINQAKFYTILKHRITYGLQRNLPYKGLKIRSDYSLNNIL